jgi:Flp pilus assembly protein TadG
MGTIDITSKHFIRVARGTQFASGSPSHMYSQPQFEPSDSPDGQILPILAVILVALLAVCALGIDVFTVYWAHSNLRRGTDAAALAGATYLIGVTFSGANPSCATYTTKAEQAACTYALTNGLKSSEIVSITPAADSRSITVTTTRTVPASFGRILGFTQYTVNATAKAGLLALNSATGALPVGLSSSTPYSYGDSIVMHYSSKTCTASPSCTDPLTSASNYGALDYGGNSGSNLQSLLTNGYDASVAIGATYNSVPGGKVGPITKGVADRVSAGIAADPGGTWSSHSLNDARAAVVPLVNWSPTPCSGAGCTATITGFAEVWISGSSGADINAVFIRQVAAGTSSSSGTDTGAVHAALMP